MADWKRLSKSLILANGIIGERETEIVRREFLADGVINRAEVEFLIELRNSAKSASPKFHEFVLDIVSKALLADGAISAAETAWLEKFLLADGKVDEMEKSFLKRLKSTAKTTSLEFDALVEKYAP
jgi:hypothetical protein